MKWNEINVNTSREAIEAVSYKFHEIGASGVSIEDPLDMFQKRDAFFGEIYELNPDHYPQTGVNVKGYFAEDCDIQHVLNELKGFLNEISSYFDTGTNEVTEKPIDDTDWANVWKAYYKPVHVTPTITIVPTWDNYQPQENEKILELDPGMAFGTGTHPTTMLCIRAIEKYIRTNQTVIDVGCGSGVLSIAAMLSGAQSVYAYDLDEVAVSSTRINAGLNGMENDIHVEQSNLLKTVEIKSELIVSNILAEIIIDLIDDAHSALTADGLFIASGIIVSKQDMITDALVNAGFEIRSIDEMEGWVCISAQKSTSKSR